MRSAGSNPGTYTALQLQEFMADYVRCGFSAGELAKRNSTLRTQARREHASFPAFGSDMWRQVNEARKSLLKKDPTDVEKAIVLSMMWILRLAASFGVRTWSELDAADAGHLYVITRLLVAHSCMMRGCEQKIRWGDVLRHGASAPTVVRVNADSVTKSTRKIKRRPPRDCTLAACGAGVLTAGAAMDVFEMRFGRGRDDEFVFGVPELASGTVDSGKYLTAVTFMARVRRLSRAAGADVDGSYKFAAQGLRLGGRTDFRVYGMSAEWIRRQGGWFSDAEKGYDQPLSHHRRVEADNLAIAVRAMVAGTTTGATVAARSADQRRVAYGTARGARSRAPWQINRPR